MVVDTVCVVTVYCLFGDICFVWMFLLSYFGGVWYWVCLTFILICVLLVVYFAVRVVITLLLFRFRFDGLRVWFDSGFGVLGFFGVVNFGGFCVFAAIGRRIGVDII